MSGDVEQQMIHRPHRPCSGCRKLVLIARSCESAYVPGEYITCIDCADLSIAEAIAEEREQRAELAADVCVRDDVTECDCSRCAGADAAWEREQGWGSP